MNEQEFKSLKRLMYTKGGRTEEGLHHHFVGGKTRTEAAIEAKIAKQVMFRAIRRGYSTIEDARILTNATQPKRPDATDSE